MAFKTSPDAGYEGLNVPMFPSDSAVIQQMASASTYDLLTLKRGSAATGSPFAIQDVNGTQQYAITKNYGLALKVRTTRPTTGLVKGEILLLFHGSTPKLGICSSTAAQTIKLIRAKTKTFGRLTA
jgi:hypothetical protein